MYIYTYIYIYIIIYRQAQVDNQTVIRRYDGSGDLRDVDATLTDVASAGVFGEGEI